MKTKYLSVLLFLLIVSSSLLIKSQQKIPITRSDSLAALIQIDKQDTTKVRHLLELGWEIMYQYPDSSILLGEQSVDLAKKISQSGSYQQVDIKQAIQRDLSKGYVQLGVYYYIKGDYSRSLDFHFKGLELRQAQNDTAAIASSYNNIGLVYRFQGDYVKALEYYMKALSLNLEIGNNHRIANNLNNIGLIYFDQKNYQKALEYYQKALAINKKLENYVILATNYNNIGSVYYAENKYEIARKYYQNALSINMEQGVLHEAANNLLNIGVVYYDENNLEMAIEYYNKALALNEEIGNKHGIAVNLTNIAEVYLKQKDYNNALKYANDAMNIAEEIGALELIKENAQHLSSIYTNTGKYQLALEYTLKYTSAKDSLFNDEKSKDIGRLEMKHEIELKERERKLKEEEEQRIAALERRRKITIQYSGMFIGLLGIGLIVIFIGFIKVPPPLARGITFFVVLLLFEFILVLLDPYVDTISHSEPVYKLFINAGLALCIFPINAIMERGIQKRLVKK